MRWELIIPALLVGGILGALIAGLFKKRPGDRFHPVGLRIAANPIFPSMEREKASDSNIVLKYKDITFSASRLFLVELQLVNMGGKDFPEFKFGIALPGGHNAIAGVYEPPDRDHAVEENPSFTPEAWAKEMDFTLRPFKKGDSYALKLYIHVGGQGGELGEIKPTTAESVRFVDIPAIGKKLEEAVRLLGPIPFD